VVVSNAEAFGAIALPLQHPSTAQFYKSYSCECWEMFIMIHHVVISTAQDALPMDGVGVHKSEPLMTAAPGD